MHLWRAQQQAQRLPRHSPTWRPWAQPALFCMAPTQRVAAGAAALVPHRPCAIPWMMWQRPVRCLRHRWRHRRRQRGRWAWGWPQTAWSRLAAAPCCWPRRQSQTPGRQLRAPLLRPQRRSPRRQSGCPCRSRPGQPARRPRPLHQRALAAAAAPTWPPPAGPNSWPARRRRGCTNCGTLCRTEQAQLKSKPNRRRQRTGLYSLAAPAPCHPTAALCSFICTTVQLHLLLPCPHCGVLLTFVYKTRHVIIFTGHVAAMGQKFCRLMPRRQDKQQ